MSTRKSNNLYKKYRCRYFDDKGRPMKPNCKQGSNCRFVHPEDGNWPGLSITSPSSHPLMGTRKIDYAPLPISSKPNAEIDISGSPKRSALVPQTDLFKLCKVESDDDTSDFESRRYRGEYSTRQYRNIKNTRGGYSGRTSSYTLSSPAPYVAAGGSYHRSPPSFYRKAAEYQEEGHRYNEDIGRYRESPTSKGLLVDTVTDFLSGISSVQPPSFKAPVEKMVSLFRDLANKSNISAQSISVFGIEEKKLHTFTEISETLAKISTSTSQQIAPTIADITLRHAQSRQQVDDNLSSLGHTWEQIFDVVMSEVASIVDRKLEITLGVLKMESDKMMREINSTPSIVCSRKRLREETNSQDDKRVRKAGSFASEDIGMYTSHETGPYDKRRKVEGWDTPAETGTGRVNSDEVNFMVQMKVQIEQQAQALALLTKENSELKSIIHTSDAVKTVRNEGRIGERRSRSTSKRR